MKAKGSQARAYALSALLCLIGISFAWWIHPRLLPPSAPQAYGDKRYDSDLRDREGRKIFPSRRPLAYVLSPFTFYRLAPDQHLPWLNTDSKGNRITPGSGGNRPISILLGGSTAMGYGAASDEETISAGLQRLRKRESWVNEAVAGFSSGNELAQLVHYADAFRPLIYVDLNGWNDFDADPRRSHMAVFGFSDFWMAQVEDRLSEYYLASVPPADQDEKLELPVGRKLAGGRMLAQIIETYQSNVLKMHDFARARGARYFLVLQPKPLGNVRAAEYESFARRITGFCSEKAIECLDLNAVDQIRSAGSEFYSGGVHLSPGGNAMVARVISDWLDLRLSTRR